METKIKPNKPFKNKLRSRILLLPSKSGIFAINGDSRQGISKWEQSYLNEKSSHPLSSAFLHQLPEVTSSKKPLRPCNVWSETFWEMLKVTHSPKGMVIHFFLLSLLCSLLSPIYFFFFPYCSFSDQSITVTLSPSPPHCEPAHPLEAESYCGGGK